MISKVTAGLGSLALVSAGFLGFSTSAEAVALPIVYASCNGTTISFMPSTQSATTGDTITLQINGPFDVSIAALGTTGGATSLSGTGVATGTYTVSGTSGGSLTLTRTAAQGGFCASGAAGTFTFTGSTPSPSGGSSSSTSPSAPTPVFQQFGKPATGTCADAAAATLNWAGVANGGWGESWAQWMNGGKGGAVCNRALIYSLGLSKWVVNA